MPRTKDSRTFSVEEWDALAEEGDYYRDWFTGLARLQDAVDSHLVEAEEGLTCSEQVANMKERVMRALRALERVAETADRMGC